jgi:hypothetical protein
MGAIQPCLIFDPPVPTLLLIQVFLDILCESRDLWMTGHDKAFLPCSSQRPPSLFCTYIRCFRTTQYAKCCA